MSKHKSGYETLLQEVIETVKQSPEGLQNAIETSEKVVQAASDMTKDELALISAYMKADLHEFAEHYEESKSGPFSVMISNSIWEALASITDRTALEWAELHHELDHQGSYRAGDVIGLGVLVCEHCGHKMEYNHPTEIIPCTTCGHDQFSRVSVHSKA
ncbi:zinc ribbon-containing protein [Vibrio sp. MEBiC08052]|uniref:zinc ribbon-containing protein n=1 Tax=Vibrio sp. MEBiC08052 TaxID=1761910 RepID=UPI0007406C77|nr:zinc ribbon-containing protein [Vibrio sp. MEBiC08052]KUJ00226.1 hypothetical protein VRK_09390 [Vibrio sp. MEBiC08052]